VVLTGSADYFSAGTDLEDLAARNATPSSLAGPARRSPQPSPNCAWRRPKGRQLTELQLGQFYSDEVGQFYSGVNKSNTLINDEHVPIVPIAVDPRGSTECFNGSR
jgi:hypothetical protein